MVVNLVWKEKFPFDMINAENPPPLILKNNNRAIIQSSNIQNQTKLDRNRKILWRYYLIYFFKKISMKITNYEYFNKCTKNF